MISQMTAIGPAARESCQIHRRFGMAGALQHAAGPRAQRKDVPGLNQIFRHRRRLRHDADCLGAIGGADAGGDAASGIDADLKVGFERLAVLANHAFDAELLQGAREWSARRSIRARASP